VRDMFNSVLPSLRYRTTQGSSRGGVTVAHRSTIFRFAKRQSAKP
jgi:hypothetical protein